MSVILKFQKNIFLSIKEFV